MSIGLYIHVRMYVYAYYAYKCKISQEVVRINHISFL